MSVDTNYEFMGIDDTGYQTLLPLVEKWKVIYDGISDYEKKYRLLPRPFGQREDWKSEEARNYKKQEDKLLEEKSQQEEKADLLQLEIYQTAERLATYTKDVYGIENDGGALEDFLNTIQDTVPAAATLMKKWDYSILLLSKQEAKEFSAQWKQLLAGIDLETFISEECEFTDTWEPEVYTKVVQLFTDTLTHIVKLDCGLIFFCIFA